MADLSPHFREFANIISLTKTDRFLLRKARTNITRKLKTYFREYELPQIEFRVQGSFTMNTIIRSLHDPFDIDIGLYLTNAGNKVGNWPKPERVSQWIINALDDHTSFTPKNKKKCVRILYKGGNDIAYHVDIPIYIEFEPWTGQETRIGIIGEKQWGERSDPTGFTKWFMKKCERNSSDKNQLIRLVQYLKAWKDYMGQNQRFPSGMALTSIMAKNFVPNERDDISFKETIRLCLESLDWFFWVDFIESPVQPYNSLTKKLTKKQMQVFFSLLEELLIDIKISVDTKDFPQALTCVKKHFDYRFT